MCTAVTYKTKDFYFGRTLDYELSYGEHVVITPRRYPFRLIEEKPLAVHYAIIGVAHVANGYPLYYDAINEKGLAMAGLNFVGYARYHEKEIGKDNIAQYEFIPWVLGQCATVKEARALVERVNLLGTPFDPRLPVAELHWMISDREESITVESVESGIKIYDNPVGVLTNNPTFDLQMFQLNNYMGLSAGEPGDRFAKGLKLKQYSRGMGAIGLPGDLSSQSRFVRAAFVKMNAVSGDSEAESVSQFFHIIQSVEQPKGCCCLGDGKYVVTTYTSCCNTAKGIYYYTTYNNHQITAIHMHRENLDGCRPICYPLIEEEQIRLQN